MPVGILSRARTEVLAGTFSALSLSVKPAGAILIFFFFLEGCHSCTLHPSTAPLSPREELLHMSGALIFMSSVPAFTPSVLPGFCCCHPGESLEHLTLVTREAVLDDPMGL